jgi:hypothetical protein
MTRCSFLSWVATQLDCGIEELAAAKLDDAFAVLVCRVEDAARRNADDPLAVIRNSTAGGNSRAATRSMLRHLGYSGTQLRIVQRLLGGSPSGWPGMLSLYAAQRDLTAGEQKYARRQLSTILESGAVGSYDRKGAMAS